MQSSSGRFPDENDVKIGIDLKDHIDNEIVFSNVLRKKFQVLQNYRLLVFTAKQIKFFLIS